MLLVFLHITLESLLCVIIDTMRSFQKEGKNYLITIKVVNCCHNIIPRISIKINLTYKYTFTCVGDKSQVFKPETAMPV